MKPSRTNSFPASKQPPSGPVGVTVKGFGWRYPGRRNWALRNLSFEVQPGERVLLAGTSGVGKSTLLRVIGGLAKPDSAAESTGSIAYLNPGLRLATPGPGAIGFMLQDPESNLLMPRVGDDIAFGLENSQVPNPEIWPRTTEALAAVGFNYGLDRPVTALSGGEKQRVALAAVLARKPGLLLLDEPTANLDQDGAEITATAIGRVVRATRSTLLLVEHRLRQVEDLVDRLIAIDSDGVVVDGPIREVLVKHRERLLSLGLFLPGAPAATGLAWTPKLTGNEAVTAHGVTVVRKPAGQLALADVSASAEAGAATALMGPNGAGKSTLARVMGGLLKPDKGFARVPNSPRPLFSLRSRDLAKRVGSVFQEPEHQFVSQSVFKELTAGGQALGLNQSERRQRAAELLAKLHLEPIADANPYTLSGGEKRRLGVATALIGSPEVLILDEPTFGQDAHGWHDLVELLIDQLSQGRCLVTVTHDAELVSALAASTVHLDKGRRVA